MRQWLATPRTRDADLTGAAEVGAPQPCISSNYGPWWHSEYVRTELAKIYGYAEILHDMRTVPDGEHAQMVDTIYRAADELCQTMNRFSLACQVNGSCVARGHDD